MMAVARVSKAWGEYRAASQFGSAAFQAQQTVQAWARQGRGLCAGEHCRGESLGASEQERRFIRAALKTGVSCR